MNGKNDKCNDCRWRVAYPTRTCMLRISDKNAECRFKPAFTANVKKKDRLVEAKGA